MLLINGPVMCQRVALVDVRFCDLSLSDMSVCHQFFTVQIENFFLACFIFVDL